MEGTLKWEGVKGRQGWDGDSERDSYNKFNQEYIFKNQETHRVALP